MNHLLARRPGEDREASILGGYQGESIALIVDELCGREMSRSAVFGRVDDHRKIPDDGFGNHPFIDVRAVSRPPDLGPEREQFISIVDDCGAIDRS